ncbi:ATP-binding protein [uncultured Draconibacterium sp.]|uniref:ATP-binding protein n=1 Tax=uncultured Draconibacterium sp. TaxID=1573823 RepID=UPI002AA724A4|nr:ATP-binding protein [uncultured Draconibacterium sp.]
MPLTNRTIVAPKNFKANSIISFINDCEDIYGLINKNEPGFLLDLGKIQKCGMIGVLLVYKIIEFSIKNKCFNGPMYLMSPVFQQSMNKYGFTKLILAYLADKKKAEKEFSKLKVSVTDEFIIAPHALLRHDRFSSEVLNTKYLPQIENYYSFDKKVVSMIFQTFSEVLLNFWEHAVDDTQSIIVANGNKTNIEIACADNGRGVLTTLTMANKQRRDKIKTLMSAVKKGVTSKEMTNHMGYGLWIVDEIVNRANGRFHLYSEGFFYQREFKKVKYGKCGHWQGTIVYISLPINNPVTLSDIENLEDNNNFNVQINWS